MSKPRESQKALLFFAILYSVGFDIDTLFDEIKVTYGDIDIITEPDLFIHTDYYEKEMGKNLTRIFVVFKKLVPKDFLVGVKKYTDALEEKKSINGSRVVNIDPGLVTMENVILATNKAFMHRIYLSNSVYGEVTLYYRWGTYRFISEWTFPEYRTDKIIAFFNSVRKKLA